MEPIKIAFYGLFGQQNLGNDCTLQAILYHVRKHLPDVETICICTGPEDTSVRFKISAFPISQPYPKWLNSKAWVGLNKPFMRLIKKLFIRLPMELLSWVTAFKILKDVQLVIAPGTGLLTDYATKPLGIPYDVFKWSMIAKLCRCQVLFINVGAGPIYHRFSRWFIIFSLSMAAYRSYRDNYSKKYIKNLGFDNTNDDIYPDLAFSLPKDLLPGSLNLEKEKLVIGVGLKDYYGRQGLKKSGGEDSYSEYINKIGNFVIWLLNHEYIVRLLIGDSRYDNHVKADVLEFISRHEPVNGFARIVNDPINSVEDLMSQISQTDVVVSPRFHNIILGLMLQKPVISLSYNEKFESLMAEFGMSEYCQNLDSLDVDSLIKQLKTIEYNNETLKHNIFDKTKEYRRVLEEQYKNIFQNI